MGEKRPADAQGDVHGWGKWQTIKTPLQLPRMRGLTLVRTLTSEDLVPQAQHKVGWHEYAATRRALEILSQRYTFARESLLD
jgi:hypothetical protein